MLTSVQVRGIALAVAVASASTPAPARAQAPPREHEDEGLPTKAPDFENWDARNETAHEAQPKGSAGVALFLALFGPVGLALGGLSVAAAADNVIVPFSTGGPHPSSPAGGPTGAP
jgi:hypothetical protein